MLNTRIYVRVNTSMPICGLTDRGGGREGGKKLNGARGIQAKVRSRRGASLPLALLLFLVCALLASVVLSASTAASGRNSLVTVSGEQHSRLALSDQAYYSVASAVGLFQKEFMGTPVTITCEQEKRVVTTTTYNSSGSANTGAPVETTLSCQVKVNGKQVFNGTGTGSISKSGLSLVELSAVYALLGGDTIDPSNPWGDAPSAVSSPVKIGDYELDCSVNASSGVDAAKAKDALAVKVHEKLLEDGRVQLRFDSPHAEQAGAASYSLTLYLDSDVDTNETTEEGAVDVSTTGSTRTETKTVKSVRSATVMWTLSELAKTAGGAA